MSENVDEFLAHYGVPGMHWGHRKSGATSSPKPTGQQITEARARQDVRRKAVKTAKKTKNPDAVQKAIDAFNNNPDRAIGAHMTRGEKFTAALISGASGGAPASRNTHLEFGKQYAQAVTNSQLGLLTIPVQAHRAKKLQIQQQS